MSAATIRKFANIAIVLMLLSVVGRLFAAELVHISSTSMTPTLHDGERAIVEKVTYRFRPPHVGEIVTVRVGDGTSIKRVVGVGGDTIEIYEGKLLRNGKVLQERYADNNGMSGHFFGPLVVPKGKVFVLGDHRLVSTDSRRLGPIPLSHVTGRLLVTI